jgi:hypothetical protein
MGAIAGAIGTRAPQWVVYALAPLVCLSISASRPAQAALLPSVVRTPEELTAANVLTGWSEGASGLLGPALAGLLVAVRGPWLAITATALLALGAGLLVLKAPGPEPVPSEGSAAGQLASNLRAAGSDPSTRVLLIMHAYYYCLIGALDLLCVVLALSVLHLGRGGSGYLNAAVGLGLILAAPVTALVVGRRRRAGTMMAGIFGSALALAVLGIHPTVIGAYLLLVAVGFGGSVFDVTGRTLLQRAVPSDSVAGVFAVLESLKDAGMLIGIVVVRLATGVGGYRAALIAPALLGVVLGVLLWRRLRSIDGSAHVPQVEVSLLRRLPIVAPLPAPSIEALARRLVPLRVSEGAVLMKEGEPGDRYFAVADGPGGRHPPRSAPGRIGPGRGVRRDRLGPRRPAYRHRDRRDSSLGLHLGQRTFVLALTGHPAVEARAKEVASDHLRSHHAEAGDDGGG